ncbi:MAG: dihydropteroate synthase [Bacteroidota bacterium]|nr:dihydropteroate synthase [Bacteroidota bacterium]
MTINCKGNLIDLSVPRVMGILNFTPDSFYDGGRYNTLYQIFTQVEKMVSEGADFIDVGLYSSRPNAPEVSEEEELFRLTSILSPLMKTFPDVLFSIDTFRSQVANIALNEGFCMVNDISGGNFDKHILEVVAHHKVPYIMMHSVGTPQTMQFLTKYDHIINDILKYFSKKINEARILGIDDLILDVGFGFAKTTEQNFELLNALETFSILELPLLVGISRKSMIYKTLNITSSEALNGTTALNAIALYKGANILRVHDVKEAVETVKLVSELKRNLN